MWLDSSESDAPSSEFRGMNQHLASCTDCRGVLAKLRESQLLTRTLREDAVNAAVLNRIHHNVMDQVAELKRAPSWIMQLERSLFFGLRRKYALAGVGILVLACGGVLGTMWIMNRPAKTIVGIPQVPASSVAAATESVAVNPPAGKEPQPAASRRVKHTPVARAVSEDSSKPSESPSKIMVRLYTDDPNVVIYWTLD
jgi:hypothetical protein